MGVDGRRFCQKIANKRLMHKSAAMTRMNQAYLIASKRFAFPRQGADSVQGKIIGIHEATRTEIIAINQEKKRVKWRASSGGKARAHSSSLRWDCDNLYYFKAHGKTIRFADVSKA